MARRDLLRAFLLFALAAIVVLVYSCERLAGG